jgi:putative tryptophan/tyrosine transport system substrate-binding protein
MRRRQFILGLGGVAAFYSFAAFGQRARARVGILSINSPESEARFVAAFKEGLQGLGHIEGRTIDIDYRASSGDTNSLAVLAQELIRLNPQVMLANSVTPTRTISRIAPNMPIVCPGFSDGFIPSLATSFARPGGRVTGVASDVESMIGKLAELVSDIFPDATQIGYLSNPAGGSMGRYEQQVKIAAKAHGMEVRIAHAEKRDEINAALRQLADAKVRAVIVPTNGLLNASRVLIVATAMDLRMPLVFGNRDGAMAGGLASYGIDAVENYRRAAGYVDKILKGAAPGDLPIEFPTKIELVINLKTAKALGVKMPAILIDRANEIIE